jgi:hypothetical protein
VGSSGPPVARTAFWHCFHVGDADGFRVVQTFISSRAAWKPATVWC